MACRKLCFLGIVAAIGLALALSSCKKKSSSKKHVSRAVTITAIHPPEGISQGGIMKIHGHKFSALTGENTVLVDGTMVGILYEDHHLIRAMVPASIPMGNVVVEVIVTTGTEMESSQRYPYEVLSFGTNWVVEAESNNTFASANTFSLDGGEVDIQSAVIDPSGDLDYYRLTYSPGNFPSGALLELDIEAMVQGSMLDSVLVVYDQNRMWIGFNDDSGGTFDSFLAIPLPSAGEFFVRVEDYSGAGSPNHFYDLNISVRGTNTLFVPTFSDFSIAGYGFSMGDITGDGLPEIMGSRVAVNQGDGTFVPGITLDTWAHSVTFGDVENDGDNDLFVSNHSTGFIPNIFYLNQGYPNLVNVTSLFGLPLGGNVFIALFVDYDQDGWLDILTVADARVQMYKNDGFGTYFTLQTGIGLDNIIMTGHCSSAAFADYDNDGDQDLFIVREAASYDLLMEFDRATGTYRDVTTAAGVGGQFFDDGYSAEWGDFNNDGWLDIYVANYTNAVPNYLYENNQDGTFTSLNLPMLFTPTYDNDGSTADFNNDGWLDIMVSDLLFINLDGTGFREASVPYGLAAASSWMAAVGDVDGNGTIDIFDTFTLYTNQGNGLNWIELQLVGGAPTPGKSNRSAIGARVTLTAGGMTQIREINGGTGYVGQHDMTVHFGLALESRVDKIEILWPSGELQVLNGVAPNQRLTVTEP
ncbi:MAG: FG-GAP-like repeat-containing protein [Planctomycetota bacterium]|nr:FG-GAP-like repeat-containing protein [Planctomycetota bacterium]